MRFAISLRPDRRGVLLRVRGRRRAGAGGARRAGQARCRRKSCRSSRPTPRCRPATRQRIREVVETKLLPYFDFERITALAMGRNWRQATPEQQKQLVEQFRALLVRTYSGALAQYRDQTMDYKPLRADASATEVTVRTEVVRPGQAPVQIDYSMAKTAVRLEGLRRHRRRRVARHQLSRRVQRADQERRRRRPDQDADGEEPGSAGEVSTDARDAAVAGERRASPAAGDRWTFSGALTFDDATAVLGARGAHCRCRRPASSTWRDSRMRIPRRSPCCWRCSRRAAAEGTAAVVRALAADARLARARLRHRGSVRAVSSLPSLRRGCSRPSLIPASDS